MSGKLRLNGATSGYIELQAADTANNATLTVPNDGFGGGGKILQVVQTTKTDVQTIASQTFVEIAALNLTITPSATTSKVLLMASPCINFYGHGEVKLNKTIGGSASDLIIGDEVSTNRQRSHWRTWTSSTVWSSHMPAMQYLDSPSTTAEITYKILVATPWSSGYTTYINRTHGDGNYVYAGTGASTFTAMEVGE